MGRLLLKYIYVFKYTRQVFMLVSYITYYVTDTHPSTILLIDVINFLVQTEQIKSFLSFADISTAPEL